MPYLNYIQDVTLILGQEKALGKQTILSDGIRQKDRNGWMKEVMKQPFQIA